MAQSVLFKQAPRVSSMASKPFRSCRPHHHLHWENLAAKQASCTIEPPASRETIRQFQMNAPHVFIGHSVGWPACGILAFDCLSRAACIDILNSASICLSTRRSMRTGETFPMF
jgi:hypothetical protein